MQFIKSIILLSLLFPSQIICTPMSDSRLESVLKTATYHTRIFKAISYVESKHRVTAVGDRGKSVGLCQLHFNAIKGIVDQGLIPLWNNTPLTLKRALKLRNNPYFNLYASQVLFNHNYKILSRYVKKHSKLIDLTIMAHNEGVTKTLRRSVLRTEPTNPKVIKYLSDVKAYMEKDNGRK